MNAELIDPEKQVKLEVWKYNPKMFSRDNTADTLSVALSFVGNYDERVEEAVEELIEGSLKGMVNGFTKFKEKFKGYEDQYVNHRRYGVRLDYGK